MDRNGRDFYEEERFREQNGTAETISSYTAKTFLWMFLGLLTTFVVAFLGYTTEAVYFFLRSTTSFLVLGIIEVAVVLFLSARIMRLSVSAARALFFLYAVLNGVVFSAYFVLFSVSSLILIFAATAVYFGALAAYGYLTKTDLSRLRPILVGGLIFLLIFGVLSWFLPLGGLDRIYCLIGIAIFLGFTAYDTQKIRQYYAASVGNPELAQKASIISALQLYLDFINLFLYLLRFLGKRKN